MFIHICDIPPWARSDFKTKLYKYVSHKLCHPNHFLSVWFSGLKYIHMVVQPAPLPISKTFSLTWPYFDNTQNKEQMQTSQTLFRHNVP